MTRAVASIRGGVAIIAVDHAPTTPAMDDRPLKLLDRAAVAPEHKQRLMDLVRHAQQVATAAGRELQSEFGKSHVALIVGCNQFLRLGRDDRGAVELLLPDAAKAALDEAGFALGEPEGQLFKMFGWIRVDPMQGAEPVLREAVQAAFDKAAK